MVIPLNQHIMYDAIQEYKHVVFVVGYIYDAILLLQY